MPLCCLPIRRATTTALRLFGAHIDRRPDGGVAFTGQDPRVSWELDYAEAYWITHCIAGELLVNLEKLQHPSLSDDEARTRVLDSLAAQISDAIRPKLAEMGVDGVMDLLPSAMDVEPESRDDSTVKALDAVVQRFDVGGVTHESMVVQLQTLRELPSGEELPASILAENPYERTGLAVTGWSILRQVRDTVMNTFDLDESDFDADAPCLLAGPKTITIGGQDRRLEALDADVVPRTHDGRLVVDGTVSAETTLYDFNARFKVTYEMGLDDIPRDPDGPETRRADLETIESLEQALSAAGVKKRAGQLSTEDYETEVKRVRERLDDLPKTVGVRPTQNPPEAEVNPDFSLTVAGKVAAAAGAAATVGLLALPVTWVAGAAGVGTAGAGGLLTLAIVQYLTTVLTIDWFGVGLGSRQVKQSLNDRPEGTSLPPIGIPIEVDFNRQRLAVYFRPLPAKLWIGCVSARTTKKTTTSNPTFGSLAVAGPPMASPGSCPTTTPCCTSTPANCSCSWNRTVSAVKGRRSVLRPPPTDGAICRWKTRTPTNCIGSRGAVVKTTRRTESEPRRGTNGQFKTHKRCNDESAARAPESTSVGLFKCVEPPVRCDSTVDRLM